MSGVNPLLTREVHVGIPETGKDDAAGAGKFAGARRKRDSGSHGGNPAIENQDRGVMERRGFRGRVDRGVKDSNILPKNENRADCKPREDEQSNPDTPGTWNHGGECDSRYSPSRRRSV